jgi:hypothetical protein
MKTTNSNISTLEAFKEKNYGKRGSMERDALESGYEAFKIGALGLDHPTKFKHQQIKKSNTQTLTS